MTALLIIIRGVRRFPIVTDSFTVDLNLHYLSTFIIIISFIIILIATVVIFVVDLFGQQLPLLLVLQVHTRVLEAQGDDGLLQAGRALLAGFLGGLLGREVDLGTLVSVLESRDVSLHDLREEETEEAQGNLDRVNDKEVEVLLGQARVDVVGEVGLLQGQEDNKGLHVENHVHDRGHLGLQIYVETS